MKLYWQFLKLDYRVNRATKGRIESMFRAVWSILKPLPF